MPIGMRLGRSELLVGHVDTDDLALGPNELGDQIGIASRSEPDRARARRAAPVARRCRSHNICVHLLMHVGEQCLELGGDVAAVAAGRGLEVLRAFRTLP